MKPGGSGRLRRLLAAALVLALVVFALPGAAVHAVEDPVDVGFGIAHYKPPVQAEVIDPFRPPAHIGAPGNRGLEYGNDDYTVVGAAAEGRVLFAGQVAGRNAITIQHNDGVRTTYTGLFEVWVVAEQTVSQDSAIALASRNLHFGARIRDHYLDPQILIDKSEAPARPRLVPPPPG